MATMMQLQDPEGRPWRPTFKRRHCPIRIHQVHAEEEYDPLQHGRDGGFARFLAEQQRRFGYHDDNDPFDDGRLEIENANDPLQNVTVMTLLSIRRKTWLALLLMTLVEVAKVDICYLMPIGLIVYSVALQVAWEQWTIEQEQNLEYQRHLVKIKRDLDEARDRIDFENRVIKNKWHIDLVPEYREETSQWVLWSVPKCPTPVEPEKDAKEED